MSGFVTPAPSFSDPAGALDELRARIDMVDDALLEMLRERALLVEEVRNEKSRLNAQNGEAGEGGLAFRPAREARIFRRLLSLHSGPPPFEMIYAFWRELISGSTYMQTPFEASVYAPGDRANRARMRAAARLQVGAQPSITMRDAAGRMFQDIALGKPRIGFAPSDLSAGAAGEPAWWLRCLDHSDAPPRIVGAAPFVGRQTDAFIIAACPLEPSGDDETLVVARLDGPLSRAAAASRVGKASIGARLLASVEGALLIALDGFHEETPRHSVGAAPGVMALAEALDAPPSHLRVIGAYARPLRPG